MSSADKLKRFFKTAELHINSEGDEKIFQDVYNAQQKTIKSKTTQSVSIGRIIANSKLTKLASAALVMIGAIVGIAIVNSTTSIALGDVLRQIEKSNALMFKVYMKTTKMVNNSNNNPEIQATMLISKEYGLKMISETLDPNSNKYIPQDETYLLAKKNIMITITPSQKRYTQNQIDSDYFERLQPQYYNPAIMVKQILECDYSNIGRATIDGITVEGFQTTDPNYQGGMYSAAKFNVKLWVSIKTKLPVKMEMNFNLERINQNIVLDEFQWNIAVNETDFEPNIPPDYKDFSSGNEMPSITEEIAIKGLKLCMDLTEKYPEKVTPDTLQPQVAILKEAQDKLELHSENPEEQAKYQTIKNIDISKTIQGMALFYIMLNQDKREPAYYGDIVSPGDAGYVLMRWKVSDYDYRVIFGDLTAETIPFETLVQLEQNLPEE